MALRNREVVSRGLSAEQVAEVEQRAAAWLARV
jgi:hypothetical protein